MIKLFSQLHPDFGLINKVFTFEIPHSLDGDLVALSVSVQADDPEAPSPELPLFNVARLLKAWDFAQ